MMEAIALQHAAGHGHDEEYTTTGIPHDKMGMGVSLFGSVCVTTPGFHGFHVFCGVICMAFVTGKAFLGKYTQARHQGIETLGLYWHFVDLVWIVLFTIIYLI